MILQICHHDLNLIHPRQCISIVNEHTIDELNEFNLGIHAILSSSPAMFLTALTIDITPRRRMIRIAALRLTDFTVELVGHNPPV